MVQKCLVRETKWCAHIKLGYQKCKVVTSTAKRGMSSIQVVTLTDYFFKESLPVWWTMSQIIPSENRYENKCWPPLKQKVNTVSTSASYQQVTGSEIFLGDSTQRKRSHCRCLKTRVSPDPSTQAFQYPPPSDMAATAAVPPDVPQHTARLLNSVLYISVHQKAASFVIREPAAQLRRV